MLDGTDWSFNACLKPHKKRETHRRVISKTLEVTICIFICICVHLINTIHKHKMHFRFNFYCKIIWQNPAWPGFCPAAYSQSWWMPFMASNIFEGNTPNGNIENAWQGRHLPMTWIWLSIFLLTWVSKMNVRWHWLKFQCFFEVSNSLETQRQYFINASASASFSDFKIHHT